MECSGRVSAPPAIEASAGAKGKLQTIIVLIVAMHTRLPSLGQQRPIHDVQFESAYPPIALQLTAHALQYRADSRIDGNPPLSAALPKTVGL